MMKPFLKLRNTILVFSRLKSKLSSGQRDKEVLKRLNHESDLLFGEPLKKERRKSRKNVKIESTEDPDECFYYDDSTHRILVSNDASASNVKINDTPVQTAAEVDPLPVTNETISLEKSPESDKLLKPAVGGSVLLFPLFNEEKKDYVPTQTYYINPVVKNSFRAFPTVTTILTETMSQKSKFHLDQWKTNQVEELGQDKFDEQQKRQLQSRNVLMKLIKKRLLGVRTEDLDIAPEFQGCWRSLDSVFPLFSNLKTMEKMVVHPELKYKGMIDTIIEFKNKPVLVCWKKSNKMKSSINMTFDAPVQIAAYIGALNYDDSYPFKVEESLLVMSYEDGSKADVFHLKKENCFNYWKMWLERLHLYQSLHRESDAVNQTLMKSEVNTTKIGETASSSSTGSNISVNANQISEKPETTTSKIEYSAPSPSTGFNTPAYTTFAEIPTKSSKINEEPQLIFPLYNNVKKEYISGHPYEINPVKQDIHSYYPSVTTILSESKSDTAKFVLDRWRNNLIAQMGQEGFDTYQKNLLETGTLLHSLIQKRLLGTAEKELSITPALEGCWKSLHAVFPLFSDIKVTESNVVHEELKYKGIIDCVAEFRGKPMLIDWKKSDKVKESIDSTYDAPLQIAAYIGATNYDSLYPFKIEEGLLIFSYTDGTKADIFHLNKDSCLKYWNLWLQRLNKYRSMMKANDLRIEY
ncbi:uncharacterized protein LOC135839081 [Planococcus citri]|uniref:uncharacterized protein LOC135839081 n=1 Tax=Planococcus citri TaxID=170843 RepID=UPI0031F7E6CA